MEEDEKGRGNTLCDKKNNLKEKNDCKMTASQIGGVFLVFMLMLRTNWLFSLHLKGPSLNYVSGQFSGEGVGQKPNLPTRGRGSFYTQGEILGLSHFLCNTFYKYV